MDWEIIIILLFFSLPISIAYTLPLKNCNCFDPTTILLKALL